MPLRWTVQFKLKLVTVVAEDDVIRGDFEDYLTMVSNANVSAWRQLINARAARLALTLEDVNQFGARVRVADAQRMAGALAFVIPEADTPELGRLLGFLAAGKRPMRVFHEFAPAQKWLMKVSFLSVKPPSSAIPRRSIGPPRRNDLNAPQRPSRPPRRAGLRAEVASIDDEQ